MQKPKTYRNPQYLTFVRSLPCCVCKRTGVDPHHVDTGGTGIKCSDARVIPLCHKCHTECHATGRLTFQRKHNIDFKVEQIKCLEGFMASLFPGKAGAGE